MAKIKVDSAETSSSKDLLQEAESSPTKKTDKKPKKSDNPPKKKTNPVPVVEQKLGSELESQGFDDSKHLRTRTALLLLLSIFAVSLVALLFVYYSFPQLEQ
jgi:hypothetical protein